MSAQLASRAGRTSTIRSGRMASTSTRWISGPWMRHVSRSFVEVMLPFLHPALIALRLLHVGLRSSLVVPEIRLHPPPNHVTLPTSAASPISVDDELGVAAPLYCGAWPP